jgi:hypothetical protein
MAKPKESNRIKFFLGTTQDCAPVLPESMKKLVGPLHAATHGKRKYDVINFSAETTQCFIN